jgi:hypothetical protein
MVRSTPVAAVDVGQSWPKSVTANAKGGPIAGRREVRHLLLRLGELIG